MQTLDSVMVETDALAAESDAKTGLERVRESGRESLPVADSDGNYVGMLDADTYAEAGDTCAMSAERAEPMHAADAPTSLLRIFAEQGRDSVAVVDNSGHMVGMADRGLTLRLMSSMTGADTPGATVAVRMRVTDYQVSNLATIVEMTGARVLSILSNADAEMATVYIKIAQQDPYPVIDALERHGYDTLTYTGSYSMPEEEDSLRRNYNSLMKYLNS